MKPCCSWGELILILPIKVSNNKSFPQRKTCTEEWGSTAGTVELLFLKAETQEVISVYCRAVHRNVCPLVHSVEKRGNKHEGTRRERRGVWIERENKPLHFQLNHIKHSVNCNTAAGASPQSVERTGCAL